MNEMKASLDFASLLDDRPDDGVFRVDRAIYLAPEILDAEFDSIFENGWVHLCHESQVRGAGDYFATHIGRQPVFVIRRDNGGLRCLINACGRRGALLTPKKAGNFPIIACPYHGWRFDTDGKCIAIKSEKAARPNADAVSPTAPTD